MRTQRLVAIAACTTLLLAGCGGGTRTGAGVNTHPTGSTTGNLIPTTAPPRVKATTSARPKPVVTHPAAPTQRATVRPTQTAQPLAPFLISLNGDKSGKALIDPPQASVYAGTHVIWHNYDTRPHGVQAQNGGFKSGPIAPGGSYTWVAVAGMYTYQDSTRPYVNGQIQVAPR